MPDAVVRARHIGALPDEQGVPGRLGIPFEQAQVPHEAERAGDDGLDAVVLDEPPLARFHIDGRDAPRHRGRAAPDRRGRVEVAPELDDGVQAEGQRHLPGPLDHLRAAGFGVVARVGRPQILVRIPRMDIHDGVGPGDHLFGERVGDALGQGAVPGPGEHAVQVLAVPGADIDRAPQERRQVGNVHHHHGPRDLRRIEESLQAPERQDGGVLRAVDSGHERQHRARSLSVDDGQGEEGPVVATVLGRGDLEPTRHLPARLRFEASHPEGLLRGAAGGAQEAEEGSGQGSHGRVLSFPRRTRFFGERPARGNAVLWDRAPAEVSGGVRRAATGTPGKSGKVAPGGRPGEVVRRGARLPRRARPAGRSGALRTTSGTLSPGGYPSPRVARPPLRDRPPGLREPSAPPPIPGPRRRVRSANLAE